MQHKSLSLKIFRFQFQAVGHTTCPKESQIQSLSFKRRMPQLPRMQFSGGNCTRGVGTASETQKLTLWQASNEDPERVVQLLDGPLAPSKDMNKQPLQ